MPDPSAPEHELPLKPQVFQILLVLLGGRRHGYAIMQKVADATGRRVLPGALYRHLERMVDTGLIAEVDDGEPEGDSRRRDFRLTGYGRAVLEAETRRLSDLAEAASALLERSEAGR